MKFSSLIISSLFLCSSLMAASSDSLRGENKIKPPTLVDNITKTHDFGAGVAVGTANGVTGKYWTTEQSAVAGTVNFAPDVVAVSGDYLYHFRYFATEATDTELGRTVIPYGGLGLIAAFGNGSNNFFNSSTPKNTTIGVRIPIGVEFLPRALPMGFFAEVDPGVGFVPGSFGFFQADIGGRWYF